MQGRVSVKEDDIFAAITAEDTAWIQALVASNVTVLDSKNVEKLSPIQYACARKSWRCVEAIAEMIKDTTEDDYLGEALFSAVQDKQVNTARILLKADAGTTWYEDGTLNTLLHMAIESEILPMLSLLLEYNADLLKKNKEKLTPLQLVCKYAFWEMGRVLARTICARVDLEGAQGLVDLNERWQSDLEDLTIGWSLTQGEEWEVLTELSERFPLDLTVRPRDPKNPKKYFDSIAWFMIGDEKFELLCKIMLSDHIKNNFQTLFDIFHDKNDKNEVLVEVWHQKNPDTLARFLRLCDQNVLANLRLFLPKDSVLSGCADLAHAKAILDVIDGPLTHFDQLSEEDIATLKVNVELLLKILCGIPKTSAFYQEAQGELTKILSNHILPCPEMHNWTISLLKQKLTLIPTFYDRSVSASSELALRLIMMQCAKNAGDDWFVINVYGEALNRNLELQKEIRKLKRKASALEEKAEGQEKKDEKEEKEEKIVKKARSSIFQPSASAPTSQQPEKLKKSVQS